jgi:hypothetical protein
MSFTDPAVDSKHVPLHVMEDLIRSDQRLLQKLFNDCQQISAQGCRTLLEKQLQFVGTETHQG